MRKIIIVYNPRASQHEAVEREVLEPARGLKGWLVGKYEVMPTGVDKNAKKLARMIDDGDLLVAAGGDGTATIAVNGILTSNKAAVLGVLGYGNFNDMAGMLGAKRAVEYGDEYVGGVAEIIDAYTEGKVKEIYPLDVVVDDEHWRYAACYFTAGLFAESTAVFDEENVREKLQKKHRSLVFSWVTLAKWYFKNYKKNDFLPEFKLNGVMMSKQITDYVAMNSPRMARVMKGKRWFLDARKFASGTAALGKFGNLVALMTKSILVKAPVRDTVGDELEFVTPASVELHAEGEYERKEGVRKIEVKKGKALKVVMLKK